MMSSVCTVDELSERMRAAVKVGKQDAVWPRHQRCMR
jgi:hypothetical protein